MSWCDFLCIWSELWELWHRRARRPNKHVAAFGQDLCLAAHVDILPEHAWRACWGHRCVNLCVRRSLDHRKIIPWPRQSWHFCWMPWAHRGSGSGQNQSVLNLCERCGWPCSNDTKERLLPRIGHSGHTPHDGTASVNRSTKAECSKRRRPRPLHGRSAGKNHWCGHGRHRQDRKSTRLNSSH